MMKLKKAGVKDDQGNDLFYEVIKNGFNSLGQCYENLEHFSRAVTEYLRAMPPTKIDVSNVVVSESGRGDMNRMEAIIEESLKAHTALTPQLQRILEELYREGYGDAFYASRAKKLGRELRPIIRAIIEDAIFGELNETRPETDKRRGNEKRG